MEVHHDGRSHRWHRAHRLEGCDQAQRVPSRGEIAASPASGVNTLTGEGLDEVLTGAQVVVDVSNSTRFADWLIDNSPAPVR
jgi:RNA polymerase sigma factor (sigma-70 family)